MIIAAASHLAAEWEVSGPLSPGVPDVPFEEPGEHRYRATVELSGGKPLKGSLVFAGETLSTVCKTRDDVITTEVKIGDINSIIITAWAPSKSKNDRYLFYPSEMKIRHKGGEFGRCNVPKLLWKLNFDAGKNRRYLYTYFFEYWDRDRWGNSGKSDFSFPMENPLPGTVRKIVLSE